MELDQPVQVLFIFFFWYVRGAHNFERAERESLQSTKNEENNVFDEDLIKRPFFLVLTSAQVITISL